MWPFQVTGRDRYVEVRATLFLLGYIRRRSVDEIGFTTLREGMMLFMEAELR